MTLPPELVDKAGLKLLQRLTKVSVAEGKNILYEMQIFTSGEITELLTLCRHLQLDVNRDRLSYYAKRQRCMAALWILGASWSQLAMLYEVSKPTVQQSAGRIMSPDKPRLATKCTHERIAEYNTKYWEKADELVSLSLVELASWLATNTESDNDE